MVRRSTSDCNNWAAARCRWQWHWDVICQVLSALQAVHDAWPHPPRRQAYQHLPVRRPAGRKWGGEHGEAARPGLCQGRRVHDIVDAAFVGHPDCSKLLRRFAALHGAGAIAARKDTRRPLGHLRCGLRPLSAADRQGTVRRSAHLSRDAKRTLPPTAPVPLAAPSDTNCRKVLMSCYCDVSQKTRTTVRRVPARSPLSFDALNSKRATHLVTPSSPPPYIHPRRCMKASTCGGRRRLQCRPSRPATFRDGSCGSP